MAGENNNNNEPDVYQVITQEQESDLNVNNEQEEKDLIPEKEGESKKETKNKIELDKEATDTVNPLEDYLITEEIAKQYGFDRKLVGKPLSEGFNSYKNLQSFDTKLSQQIAEMNRTIGALNERLTKAEQKEVQEDVQEQLPDFDVEIQKFVDKSEQFFDDDGFMTDKKGYAKNQADMLKFISNYNSKKEELLRKEFDKKLDEKSEPTNKSVQELRVEKFQEKLYDEVESRLMGMYGQDKITPKIVEQVISIYGEFMGNEDEETQQQYTKLYSGRPNILARDIINYHKANRPDAPKKSDEEQAALDAHNKQIDKLKKTEKTFIKSASNPRDQKKEVSKEDEPYQEAINDALDDEYSRERFAGGKE